MSNLNRFTAWKDALDEDDLVHAFESIERLEVIKFECVTKQEGWIARIEEEVSNWTP